MAGVFGKHLPAFISGRMRRAFTLIELLVVIAVLALLAALLFPAFAMARGRARQSACVSNLKQLGTAITLYTSDWDSFPRGLDPADKFTPQIWQGYPNGLQIMAETPLLPVVLAPYIKNNQVWACPADTGFDITDTTGLPLDARPTCYLKYGLSYMYRTELMLHEKTPESLPKAAQTHVLADGSGGWHGQMFNFDWTNRRYNVLYADQHVKTTTGEQYNKVWNIPLE